jgi:Xaa-Pro aminopeptidase
VGGGRKDVSDRYETIWNTIESLADKVGPGTTPSEVMAQFEKDYAKTDIEAPDYQGHGIGLEPREYPIMGRGGAKRVADEIVDVDTDFPLEEGMVISLETSVYDFGRGSFEIEKTFVMGKRSLREITTKKKDSSILVV